MRSLVLLLIPLAFFISLVGIVTGLDKPTEQRPACVLDDCPFELTVKESGSAFVYRLTSRFSVILDQRRYPKSELSCSPEGILGSISNIPSVQSPLYAARFDAVATGTCELKDRDFSVRITVVAGDNAAVNR